MFFLNGGNSFSRRMEFFRSAWASTQTPHGPAAETVGAAVRRKTGGGTGTYSVGVRRYYTHLRRNAQAFLHKFLSKNRFSSLGLRIIAGFERKSVDKIGCSPLY